MAKVERNIKVGQKYPTEHGGKNFELQVVDHDGVQAFRVVDAKGKNFRNADKEIAPGIYRSVSSAAGAVMGPGNVNGWKFWGIDPADAPKAKTSGEGKAAAPKAKGTAKAEPKAKVVQGSKASKKAGPVTTKVKGKGKAKAVAVLDEDEEEDDEDEEMDFEEDEDEEDE